jgi:outer membrane protein OmpA-like peptidoglycan-associated protein
MSNLGIEHIMKKLGVIIFIFILLTSMSYSQEIEDGSKVIISVKDVAKLPVADMEFKLLNPDNSLKEIGRTDMNGAYETKLPKGESFIVSFNNLERKVSYQFDVPTEERLKSYQLVCRLPFNLANAKNVVVTVPEEINGTPRDLDISLSLQNVDKKILTNHKFRLYNSSNELIREASTDGSGRFLTQLKEGQTYFVSTDVYGATYTDEFHVSPGLKSYMYRLILPFPTEYHNSDFSDVNMTESYTSPSKDPNNPKYPKAKNGEYKRSFILNNINFATGKWDLKPSSYESLNELLKMLTDNPKMKIEIAGHTDDVGKDDANMTLSQKRAESIVNYLVEHGINEDRLIGIGYGETIPIATNDTPEGRQKNRRSEVRVIEE